MAPQLWYPSPKWRKPRDVCWESCCLFQWSGIVRKAILHYLPGLLVSLLLTVVVLVIMLKVMCWIDAFLYCAIRRCMCLVYLSIVLAHIKFIAWFSFLCSTVKAVFSSSIWPIEVLFPNIDCSTTCGWKTCDGCCTWEFTSFNYNAPGQINFSRGNLLSFLSFPQKGLG